MPLDFPSSPTNGQVYGNYYYNSARGAWNALLPAATPNFFTNATLNTSTLIDATATASAISTVPLIINGLSGQTANIQEWKSNGVLNAFVNSYGGAKFVDLKINTSSSLGSLGIIPGLASQVGVVVRGTASQTANLQEWQDSGGTVVAAMNVSGSLASNFLRPTASASTSTPLIVKAAASQTADIQQWQSSTGAVLSDINSAGELQVPRIGVGATMPTSTRLMSTASAATEIPILARGAASQTANLQEWQNSAGTTLSYITSSGSHVSRGITSQTSSGLSVFSVGDDSSGQLELGRTDGTAANPYIDFHSGATATDFDSRIQGTGGNGTSGNGSINISASAVNFTGRVATSGQPSFSSAMTGGWITVNPGNPVIFNSPQFNLGGHFNSSNGRFTAPVGGRYIFAFNFYIDGQRQASFRKNGSDYIPSDTAIAMSATGTSTTSASYLFNLAAGDYIEVGCRSGSTSLYFYSGHSWFMGYMLG